jgi:hypothetical protein
MEKNSGGNVVIHDLDFGILKIRKSENIPKKSENSKSAFSTLDLSDGLYSFPENPVKLDYE